MDKDCTNCKHSKQTDTAYPCSACVDDENGYPTKWEELVDMVNRPPHYTHGKYECIDVMVENFGKEATQHFCLLNAFKYVWRAEHKNGLEDIKKAWWYLDKYLQLESENHE